MGGKAMEHVDSNPLPPPPPPTHAGLGRRHRRFAPWMILNGPPRAAAEGSAHASPWLNLMRSLLTPVGMRTVCLTVVSPSRVHVNSAVPFAFSRFAAAMNACEKSMPTTLEKSRESSNAVPPVAQPTSNAAPRGTLRRLAQDVHRTAVLQGAG